MFASHKVDVFTEDLDHLAFSFWPIDQNVSKFLLKIEDIAKAYASWENILVTKSKEIDEARTYMKANKDYLKKLGFAKYEPLMDLLEDLWKQKDQVFDLLGKNQSQNYLIILQNTNEKRPNGWFFGSFAFVKLEGAHIKTMEIVDSYYPDFIAYRTRILAPDWTSPFLPDRKIGFIAGNKFGFTDIDGKNLKDLYELMFNKTYEMRKVQQTMQPDLYNKLLWQNIRGVIFIRSDMLEKIFPGFQQKARERQFVNAAIDIIRKEQRGNKKELYIKSIKEYFNEQKINIVRNTINKFDELANNQYLTMYFSNVQTGFNALLAKHELSNIYNPQYIYFWDMNASYNKIDAFVHKHISITDAAGDSVIESDNDIVDTQKLLPGKYTITINYDFNVPKQYSSFIRGLEKKYDITLSGREEAILGMRYGTYNEAGFGLVKKRRETRSTIYFPPKVQILNVSGETYYRTKFYPPFANGLFYQMGSIDNPSKKSMKIEVEVR